MVRLSLLVEEKAELEVVLLCGIAPRPEEEVMVEEDFLRIERG